MVDDEGELITTMAERLEYRDVLADSATSGSEALEKIARSSYDVVVIDLKMPGMSGPDLIKAIKERYPALPIFLMTGHGFDIEGEELPAGIVEYIPKPVKIDDLVIKMKEAVR